MNVYRAVSAAVLAVGLVACSWITDFAVVNNSDKPVTMTYTVRGNCEKAVMQYPPKVMPAGDIPKRAFRELSPDEFTVDKEKCEITVKLNPKEAVCISRMNTYTGYDPERARFFGVGSLKITSPDGAVQYESVELVKQFRKVKDYLYVLEYK